MLVWSMRVLKLTPSMRIALDDLVIIYPGVHAYPLADCVTVLPLTLFMAYLMPSFFCIGILFGNMNALAMEPLGHIAGVGAAVVGSLSTLVATPLGAGIGQAYNGTVTPLALGFAVFGLGALVLMRWAEGTRAPVSPESEPAA